MLLVAGPSLLESEKVVFTVAEELKKLSEKHPRLQVIFKGSFDKPHYDSFFGTRGNGMEAGLRLLTEVKNQFGLPVMTDVHERYQVEPVSIVCDALQIPSQLCQQTDLVMDAAKSGCALNIRKGSHLSPMETLGIAEKIECSRAAEIWITERGTTFGYENRAVDMRAFTILKRAECPILLDATAVSKMPGWKTPKETPASVFALPMARAALVAGADGLSLEIHPEPENALVDNATQLPLGQLGRFIEECLKLRG